MEGILNRSRQDWEEVSSMINAFSSNLNTVNFHCGRLNLDNSNTL